jgi:hypothetical protein
MSFNTTTGIITGNPSGLTNSITYTVTGTNSVGSDTFSFTMEIVPPKAVWQKTYLDAPNDMCVDSMNNYYVLSKSNLNQTSSDINGDGSVIVPSSSSNPTLKHNIIKFNSAGLALWIKSYIFVNTPAFKILCDSQDNLYMYGSYSSAAGSIDFNGNGSVVLSSTLSGTGAFLVKFNSNGVAQWVKKIYKDGVESNGSLYIKSNDDIYITGIYRSNSSDFDINGDNSVVLPYTPSNENNCFIMKLNTSGVVVAAHNISPNTSKLILTGVSTDSLGNIYVAGTNGNTSLTIGSYVFAPAAMSQRNVFLIKYNSSFVLTWVKEFGGVNKNDSVVKLKIDTSDGIYISGTYATAADLNLNGDGSVMLPISMNTNGDCYLVKYNTSGVAQWSKNYLTTAVGDNMNNIDYDSDNNVYVCGTYNSTVTVSIASGVTLPITNGYNCFLIKYNSSGDYMYHKSIAAVGTEDGKSIVVDNLNNVLLLSFVVTSSSIDLNGDGSVVIPSTSNLYGTSIVQFGPV